MSSGEVEEVRVFHGYDV